MNLLENARGFLMRMFSIAFWRNLECSSESVFLQHWQRQWTPHTRWFLKHSQYNFRQPELLQLQCFGRLSSAFSFDSNFTLISSSIYLAISTFATVVWLCLIVSSLSLNSYLSSLFVLYGPLTYFLLVAWDWDSLPSLKFGVSYCLSILYLFIIILRYIPESPGGTFGFLV